MFFFFQGDSLSSFRRWQGWEVGAPFFFFLSSQNFFQGSSLESRWVEGKENYADLHLLNMCYIYIGAASPIFTVLQQNQQDMSTIPQRTCALHFVCLCAPFLLLGCFQVGIIKINYANLFIFEGVSQGKIGFREIKASKMIFFGSLIYYYLVSLLCPTFVRTL